LQPRWYSLRQRGRRTQAAETQLASPARTRVDLALLPIPEEPQVAPRLRRRHQRRRRRVPQACHRRLAQSRQIRQRRRCIIAIIITSTRDASAAGTCVAVLALPKRPPRRTLTARNSHASRLVIPAGRRGQGLVDRRLRQVAPHRQVLAKCRQVLSRRQDNKISG
jgi:hypothetical protein